MSFKSKAQKRYRLSRRQILQLLGFGTIAAPFTGGISPFSAPLMQRARASTANPHRFLQIFLLGGWDSALTTDPALGGKANASNYFEGYWNTSSGNYIGSHDNTVGGTNPSLKIGYGLLNAQPQLQNVPMAICNGMYVEVTAHELAVNYLYSGQLSLSRSKEFAAFIATMADKTGGFPAHVVLGANIPTGTTKQTNPPLQSMDMGLFNNMLAGPRSKFDPSNFVLQSDSIDEAHQLLDTLNANYNNDLAEDSLASLNAWIQSEAGVGSFYNQNYHTQIDVTTLQNDFNYGGTSDIEARFAGALQTLQSGMTRFITVNGGNFDTHQSNSSNQVSEIQRVATALNVLLDKLNTTPDTHPNANSGDMLIDNTTILITSEFNRTPLYNSQAGTDHWTTGTAILLGRGVKADTLIGQTNDEGYALNLAGTATINSSQDADVFLPDHLAAAILRHFGFNQEASELSSVNLNGQLFNV